MLESRRRLGLPCMAGRGGSGLASLSDATEPTRDPLVVPFGRAEGMGLFSRPSKTSS